MYSTTTQTLKKQPKKPGQRVLTKTVPTDSFFHFFSPPEMPGPGELDEMAFEDLQEDLNSNYDLSYVLCVGVFCTRCICVQGAKMDDTGVLFAWC